MSAAASLRRGHPEVDDPHKYSSVKEWVALVRFAVGGSRRRRLLSRSGVSDVTIEQFSPTGHAVLISRINHGKEVPNVVSVHRLGGSPRN